MYLYFILIRGTEVEACLIEDHKFVQSSNQNDTLFDTLVPMQLCCQPDVSAEG